MALREPNLLGFNDPREVGEPTQAPTARKPRPKRAAAAKPRPKRQPSIDVVAESESAPVTPAPPPVAASAATALGDEERFFLQFMAPRVLRRRLEFAVYELGPRVPRLAEHQTILAALIWKYADYSNADALRELGGLLDVFEADPLSQLHADSKVGGNVPNSLRRMIDGAVLRLKDTHEQASRRSVGGALLWRYVDPDDTQSLDALEQTLLDYEAAAWPKRATSRSSAAA